MFTVLRPVGLYVVSLALWSAAGLGALGAEPTREPEGIGVDEKAGEFIPLDLVFTDESGTARPLRDYFVPGRPVVLIPSYYACPRLCSYIFSAVQKAAQATALERYRPGQDYLILSVSFDDRETPRIAAEKGAALRAGFRNPLAAEAWPFLTGKADAIAPLMDAIGYRYRPDGAADFTHAAAIVFLAPDGKITRYLYGIEFPEREYRLSVVEASEGKIGSISEKIYMYCFRYDALEGKYTPYAWAFMRIGAGLTLLVVIGLLFFLRRSEKKQKGA
jgi:protein SCO1/2